MNFLSHWVFQWMVVGSIWNFSSVLFIRTVICKRSGWRKLSCCCITICARLWSLFRFCPKRKTWTVQTPRHFLSIQTIQFRLELCFWPRKWILVSISVKFIDNLQTHKRPVTCSRIWRLLKKTERLLNVLFSNDFLKESQEFHSILNLSCKIFGCKIKKCVINNMIDIFCWFRSGF